MRFSSIFIIENRGRRWTVEQPTHDFGTTSKIVYCIRVKETQAMATPIFSLSPEMQATWDDIMGQMVAFVDDTNADIDSAYDWVCEMLEIDSFVDNEGAWNSFYDVWESCDNRNDLQYVID